MTKHLKPFIIGNIFLVFLVSMAGDSYEITVSRYAGVPYH
jgi:hypothetical protein